MSFNRLCINYIFKLYFNHKYTDDKSYCKIKDRCHSAGKYRGAAHIIFNLKYSIPNKTSVFFHNGSN